MNKHYECSIHFMKAEGGNFARQLAACYLVADSVNRERLLKAFANYFDSYEVTFQALKAQNERERATA